MEYRMKNRDILWILLTIILLFVFYLIFDLRKDSLAYINDTGRLLDGHVALDIFLGYGGCTDFLKWWEISLGISPNTDFTLYMGVLTLPLIILGSIFSNNPYKPPFLLGAVFFLMFSHATPVSVWAYHYWPLMKFYRHIGFIAPLIKLYFCFLAGFGFEQLFDSQKFGNSKAVFYKSIFCGLLLTMNCIFLFFFILHPDRLLSCWLESLL